MAADVAARGGGCRRPPQPQPDVPFRPTPPHLRLLQLRDQADALLAAQPQDQEYPFYTTAHEIRRRNGRGRSASRFREHMVSEVVLAEVLEAPDPPLADEVAQRLDLEEWFRRAGLRSEERACLLLKIEGLSSREIGERLRRHREWVGQRQAAAVRKLRAVALESMR